MRHLERGFPYGQAVLFSFGFFGINIIWALFNTFVPPFLTRLDLSATLIGFILTWDNYLNIFFQPVVGVWSDRTRTRLGRRKPWLLAGAPLAAFFFVAIPLGTSAPTIMLTILLTNLGMSLFRSPAMAYLGDLFRPEQRSMAGGILDVMGGLGVIVAFAGGWLFFEKLGLGLVGTFTFGSLAMLAALFVVVWRVREPTIYHDNVKPGVNSGIVKSLGQVMQDNRAGVIVLLALLCGFVGYEAIIAWLSSFAQFTLEINPGRLSAIALSFALSFLIFALPAGWLATRLGRQRTMLAGFLAMTGLLALGWFIQTEAMLIGLLVFGGASWALISVNALPLVYDFVGQHQIGTATGLYYLTVNIAAAVGPQLVGVLIDVTAQNYRMMFVTAAAAMALAAILLAGVEDRLNQPPFVH